MPPDHDEGEAEEWAPDQALLETAAKYFGVGSDAGLSSEIRFVVGVTRLIRKRLERTQGNLEPIPAVFFLLPSGPETLQDSDLERVPMLDTGRTRVEGKLWFVGPAVAAGLGRKLDAWSDDGVFELVVAELGIGTVPAILVDTRDPILDARFYRAGLAAPDSYEQIRITGPSIPIEDVLAVVDRLHGQCLVTPDAQDEVGKLWVNADQHRPSKKAEKLIQRELRSGLVGAFPSCRVQPEQPGVTGRLDLELEEPVLGQHGQIVRHALLELKVLRTYRCSGTAVPERETRKAVKDGVEQAAAYRDERGTLASALCCFDMREEVTADACFSPVRTLARRLDVFLRCWHIFGTSAAYRSQLASDEG